MRIQITQYLQKHWGSSPLPYSGQRKAVLP